MKLAFLAGYRGQNFAGSQFQPDKRTVEGEFVAGGIELGLFSDAKEGHFRTAGRTDKGVSARRQLFSITTDKPELAVEALNFHLPDDIWCLGAAEVDEEFYPRYAARERSYRYYFPYPADVAKMQDAAARLIGTHTFSGFSKMEAGRDPVRTVTRAEVFEGSDGCPVFEVAAKSFLWNMVRGMAGALQTVGLRLAEPEIIDDLLTSPTARVHPAPAEGLIFWDVVSDLSFTPMRQKREVKRSLSGEAAAARADMHTAEALLEDDPKEFWKKKVIREYSALMKKR
ncbi:tRNA pseudouridine synthase A [bioreactor metagenome]|uniref:tRNA pseudouridine synthase A n=1 Tax=bioreactor metagenome TaxID=1076179 RepID=A0A644V651_9ZZZZ|nr:tRNA pseudouridine(38-40) synthase TruA [Methanocorpusculum sp.]